MTENLSDLSDLSDLSPWGRVYLVGAGLGPRAYLTERAQQVIQQAEILLYDALIESSLLALVSPDCKLIDVGKRGGQPSTPQAVINQLLIQYCQQGKQVVRLKAGDPWIFGRLTPELTALVQAHCPVEVVPGLSSAIAGPGLVGIPLTDKDLGTHFAVISGQAPDSLDWEILARLDTLIILMGGQTLPQILSHLRHQGKPPDTPVAVIQNAGRWQQKVWWGNLTDMVEKTAQIALSPCVIVIGAVIERRTMALPLAQKIILVTRAAEQSSQFTALLQAQGAQVLEMPTLVIQAPSSWALLDQALAKLETFNWLILTSANGVNFFFERLAHLGKDSRALQGIKIAVVGKKTAQVLQNYGLKADFIPPNFVADSLITSFPEPLSGQRFLFPRVESGGREILVQELRQQRAIAVEVQAYQSVCPKDLDQEVEFALKTGQIEVITFASSKTVQNFWQLIQPLTSEKSLTELLAPVCIASIGPQTSKTCQELLGKVTVEAQEYTLEGLTQALIQWAMNPEF